VSVRMLGLIRLLAGDHERANASLYIFYDLVSIQLRAPPTEFTFNSR
jgi:hypothetical protein